MSIGKFINKYWWLLLLGFAVVGGIIYYHRRKKAKVIAVAEDLELDGGGRKPTTGAEKDRQRAEEAAGIVKPGTTR